MYKLALSSDSGQRIGCMLVGADDDLEAAEMSTGSLTVKGAPSVDPMERVPTKTCYSVLRSKVIGPMLRIAYTVQTELAQNIQRTYTESYLLFYLTHSAYTLIFPLHLLFLRPSESTLLSLKRTLHIQFSSFDSTQGYQPIQDSSSFNSSSRHSISSASQHNEWDWSGFPFWRLGLISGLLAILVAIPGGTWYYAVHLTTATDISAIYNSNCIFAFLFSRLIFLRSGNAGGAAATTIKKSRTELYSVILASIGVFIIAYGSSAPSDQGEGTGDSDEEEEVADQRLLGNLLTLLGSATFGFYEVFYSRFVSPTSVITAQSQISSPEKDSSMLILYTSFMTTLIGISSLILLSIPFLFLPKPSPPPAALISQIAIMVLCGMTFNAFFILLISLWGPVTASIGNLGTLITVAITDWTLGGRLGLETWIGGACVCAAFVGLAWEEGRKEEDEGVSLSRDEEEEIGDRQLV
ncbi:hypothetical protein BT69DRAFT_1355758 [Atractiella rhizophila]|nr:hypothetical protein BT69DRAFT_1355758 [Atractiella rhizophila]